MNTQKEMQKLLERLFPIARSITGQGVRETLKILGEHIPLVIREVPTGTKVLDWTIPKEWNIQGAYIKDSSGKKVVDFKKNNLHVLGYSAPMHKKLTLEELQEHLYSIPEHPKLIPYRTSYYKEQWGFCLPHTQRKKLKKGVYEVVIGSTLKKGSLTYGEFYIPGQKKDEILISCYLCHPSMANDNLSGVVLATFLAKELLEKKNEYSYRFLFIPETIGAITWLAKNKNRVSRIRHGLVATLVGDSGPFTYKKSRRGNADIDKAAAKALEDSGEKYTILDFFPSGSDERQFCSPGFNLPVGSLMRSMYDTFPEYHSSGDNLTLVRGEYIFKTLQMYKNILFILEHNKIYKNTQPYGEPQLGKRGLYGSIGGQKEKLPIDLGAVRWLLSFSDGKNSLLDIAVRANLPFPTICAAAEALKAAKLLHL